MNCRRINPETIKVIMVQLDIADKPALFIVLAEDGMINRAGTGAINNSEHDMYIGRTKDPLFAELRAKVQPEWMEHLGLYDVHEKAGKTCTLTVSFKASDGDGGSLRFVYGSESQGPPDDICNFVTEAVRLINPWYDRQKQTSASPRKNKPWWRFW